MPGLGTWGTDGPTASQRPYRPNQAISTRPAVTNPGNAWDGNASTYASITQSSIGAGSVTDTGQVVFTGYPQAPHVLHALVVVYEIAAGWGQSADTSLNAYATTVLEYSVNGGISYTTIATADGTLAVSPGTDHIESGTYTSADADIDPSLVRVRVSCTSVYQKSGIQDASAACSAKVYEAAFG